MPKITGVAPILLVKDVITSSEWYRDKLGFNIVSYYGNPSNFAIIERDYSYLMFCNFKGDLKPNWKLTKDTSNVYFWVDEVEKLYKEFIERGAKIDFTIHDTPWGTREFGINDLDEYDISFGEIIKLKNNH